MNRPPGTRRPAARPAAPNRLRSVWAARVLVVDDEPALAELLHRTLHVAGFDVRTVGSRAQALAAVAEWDPEIAVLDVMLPDGSGFDLCHRLRADAPDLAVVFLTARDSVEDRLTGFGLGGDDYVTKPFSVAELVARVNAVLRRGPAPAADASLAVADLEMDTDAHLVRRAGHPIDLSPTEFRLLRLLLQSSGRVLSKQQILQQVWEYDFGGDVGAVEKYVSRLRRKVDDGHDAALLHTVRGFGYVLREPPT